MPISGPSCSGWPTTTASRSKVVNFADYSQPNPALAQGQTDLNLFQHLQFLASYNVAAEQTLTPIGSTVVVSTGPLFEAHTSVKDISTRRRSRDSQRSDQSRPTGRCWCCSRPDW